MNKYSVSLELQVSVNKVSVDISHKFWETILGDKNKDVNILSPMICGSAVIKESFISYAKDKETVVKEIEILCDCYTEKLGLSVIVKSYEIEYDRIMETHNGHDEKLVESINYAYSHGNEERLTMIAKTLFERDREEAEQLGITDIDDLDNADVLYSFLMNVCDDMDLETILKFCRYDLYQHK